MALDLPQGWETLILQGVHAPVTQTNIQNLDLWLTAEGGAGLGNNALYNPFNTTLTAPGSYSINSVGVQAYTNAQQGIQATVNTLNQSNMSAIVAALQTGTTSAADFGRVVLNSPWGTGDWPVQPSPGVIGTAPSAGGGIGSAPVIGGVVDGASAVGGFLSGISSGLDNLITGGAGSVVNGVSGIPGQVVSGATSAVTGPVSTIVTDAWGLAQQVGKTIGTWLVLLLIGIFILLIVDQLATGGSAAKTAERLA